MPRLIWVIVLSRNIRKPKIREKKNFRNQNFLNAARTYLFMMRVLTIKQKKFAMKRETKHKSQTTIRKFKSHLIFD